MRRGFLPMFICVALLASCIFPAKEDPTGTESPAPTGAVVMTAGEAAMSCAQALLDSQPDGEEYHLLDGPDTEFYLSEVYGIPEECRGTAALVYTGWGVDARELAVIYGTDAAASDIAARELEAYRRRRLGDFTGYAPDQAELVEGALVMRGNLALLMICTDPSAARAAMEEELSHLVIEPYDPGAQGSGAYDWTEEVNEKGWKRFDPPGEFDMTPYDTTAILEAYASGDESGLNEKDAAILSRCREALEQCVTEGMSDFRKELELHDWLIQSYYGCYDQAVHDPKTPLGREDNLDPYGLLIRGYGICLAYATSFQLLMDLAGVECVTVIGAAASSSGDHAWNMVRLDGEWYCVDPGWDASYREGVSGNALRVWQHRYFNVTSDRMRESDHQWDYKNVPEATATRFRWDGAGTPPG